MAGLDILQSAMEKSNIIESIPFHTAIEMNFQTMLDSIRIYLPCHDDGVSSLCEGVLKVIRALLSINREFDKKSCGSHNSQLESKYTRRRPEVSEINGLFDSMGCVSCGNVAKCICLSCFTIRRCKLCFDSLGCGHMDGMCGGRQRTLVSFTGNRASIGSVSRLLDAYLIEDGAHHGWLEYFYTNPPSQKETLVNIFHELDSLLKSTTESYSRKKKSTHSNREINCQFARHAAMKTPRILNNTWSTANVFCKSKNCKNLANFPQTTRSDSSTNNSVTKGKQPNNSGVECRICVLCASKSTEEHELGIKYGAFGFGIPIYPIWRGHRFAKCMIMSPRYRSYTLPHLDTNITM